MVKKELWAKRPALPDILPHAASQKSLDERFPKIRDTVLDVPIIRTIVFWGLYWGSLYFWKLPDGSGVN